MTRPLGSFDPTVPQHICPDLRLSQAYTLRSLAEWLEWERDLCSLDDLAALYTAVVYTTGPRLKLEVRKQKERGPVLRSLTHGDGWTVYGSYSAMYAAFMYAIDDGDDREALGATWREFIDAGILRLVNRIISATGWTLRLIKKGGEMVGIVPTYLDKEI